MGPSVRHRQDAIFEYYTADNFNRLSVMKYKPSAYRHNLDAINQRFDRDSIIVFVCDVPRMKVQKFVELVKPTGLPMFFTDLEMFKRVGIGHQLAAPIYLWGENGLAYPLTHHAQLPHP